MADHDLDDPDDLAILQEPEPVSPSSSPATTAAALVGFSFGLHLPAGAWWTGDSSVPPQEILNATKFAVIELIVHRAWRGRSIGRRVLDQLLQDRSEPYATLTTRPSNPARAVYERWGWKQVGTAQHTADAPVMDQLVLDLN